MKIIKNINNNVSVCIDDDGNELIAFGKGIGFKTPPYEITDLSLINRTFYDIDHRYFNLLNVIPDEIFELSAKIVDYARNKVNSILNPNIVFTLADHIQFAIQRTQNNMGLKFTATQDLNYFNPTEVQIGEFAVRLIRKQMKVHLPNQEVYGIAMHFINAESVFLTQEKQNDNESFIHLALELIEDAFSIQINRHDFNYSRFVSHMEYLMDRSAQGTAVTSQNLNLFESIKKEFPKSYSCAEKINDLFKEQFDYVLSEEELLYLMMHINRLISREL